MKYLVSIYHPDDFVPFDVIDPEVDKAIDDLNDEMVEAGIRVFVGGLQPPTKTAKSIRPHEGSVLVTDGPYLETKEHIGGFWVLECATPDEAIEWGRKAALACRVPVQVRPFF